MRIQLLEVVQPIGVFYLGALDAETVVSMTKNSTRIFNYEKIDSEGGVQRDESPIRIKQIANYCQDPDATFPTPIILAVENEFSNCLVSENGAHFLVFEEGIVIADTIDGQHRIAGLKECANIEMFTLPVVFMFNLTIEEKAYVFSIINSTQTKVNKSLIYELFGLFEGRSPQKTCHEIARLFNSNENSPFYRRLKMLGKTTSDNASLSQGSFVQYIIRLITKNADEDLIAIKKGISLKSNRDLPFREYFIQEKDAFIYKVLLNMFKSLSEVFKKEWENPKIYNLCKTTGFGAMIRAFEASFYIEGRRSKTLTEEFFTMKFLLLKDAMRKDNLSFTSKDFASNFQEQRRLADYIVRSTSEE